MPSQSYCLHSVDLGNTAKVHVVLGEVIDCFLDVNGFGPYARMMKQLTGAKEIGEKRVVVEAPYTVGAGGFKKVKSLYAPR
jgi:hypothetical protein